MGPDAPIVNAPMGGVAEVIDQLCAEAARLLDRRSMP
jgi:hypothetical protein